MNPLKIISVLAAVACLAAACSPPATPTPVDTPQAVSITESSPAECRTASLLSTPGPAAKALYPSPTEGEWTKGPDNALITFIEYSDFQ